MARKDKEVVYSSEQGREQYTENGERIVYVERQTKKKKNPFLIGCLGLLLLMILLGACVAAMGGGNDNENSSTDTKESTSTTEKSDSKEAEKKYKIGDEVTKKNVTFKPTKAYYTDERNEFAETKADKVLVVEMDIKNNGKEDIPVGTDVSAYADGKKLESYPINDTLMDGLSSGRSISGKQGFAVVGNPKEIELEFEPFLSGEKAIYTVKPE
ncbi:DUF4352 domain-containing protein [Macrococcus brunensis]|uniref:DUF4352 domain-containing protein n=1 Tax=Macrococcus brunensis TaxID=198483 RepID=UPI001EF0371D|nr:DUF4352 domain-containing protein [Macrococcus brunensis]ULG73232.1 DUF4352 domain-containing protein [Macrococcus brunensis]